MEAQFSVFEALVVIAMFFDGRAGLQLNETDRLEFTIECREHFAHVRTPIQQPRVGKFFCRRWVRLNLVRPAPDRTEQDDTPVALIIAGVEMWNEFIGENLAEDALQFLCLEA